MESLPELFAHYLLNPRDVGVGGTLANVLERAGDGCRAAFLRRAMELGRASKNVRGFGPAGSDLGMLFGSDTFLGRLTWVIAPTPPVINSGDRGTGWFDSIELSFHAGVERGGQMSWVSAEPVRIFQYLGFLGAMRMRQQSPSEGGLPEDVFARDRFGDHPETDPVTKVYHEEASAYARWFGRALARQTSLQSFRESYGKDAVDRLMPHGLWIWSGDECDFDDTLHFAFTASTLDEHRWPAVQESTGADGHFEDLVIARHAWTRALDCGFVTELPIGPSAAASLTTPGPFVFDNAPLRS